ADAPHRACARPELDADNRSGVRAVLNRLAIHHFAVSTRPAGRRIDVDVRSVVSVRVERDTVDRPLRAVLDNDPLPGGSGSVDSGVVESANHLAKRGFLEPEVC